MNPNNTIEYNSLGWVKAQLDDVLSDAQSNLNEYIDNKTDVNLENCIEHLQLIYGTLQMVEVYGASMLAEEMKLTTAALLEDRVESEYDAYDILMRAMLQLPDYLESIQAGKTDTPITLMPLINDLRVVRKASLLTEGVMFSPDLEHTVLTSEAYEVESIESGNLQSEVKRLRTHFQLGLLDYIKNNKGRVGLKRIKAVLASLEKVSSNSEVRNIWFVAGAMIEGLINGGIESSISVKTILSNVDRQLKLIIEVGEDEFLSKYSKELVKNTLYYVSLCTVENDKITAVKEMYQLDELLPKDDGDGGASTGGLNADLFDTVSKGITEDLAQVKDVLELFMHSNEQDLERLKPVAEQLGKIADTYGMLGMGATRQTIIEQRSTLEKIISGDEEASEQVVLEIASGLLNAEAELKDYIAERSGFVDMNRDKDIKAVPASEYREVIFTVVSEAMKNFGDAKDAILSYISGDGDKEQLDIIVDRLEEVRGVAMMLPLQRVAAQIDKLQRYIRVVLLTNKHKASEEEQDTVADVVTSIEYFFEALSEGRPGVEQGLAAGDKAASKLEVISNTYTEKLDETSSDVTAINNQQAEELKDNVIIAFEDKSEAMDDEVVTTQDTEQYIILADDADEEIVEIFIEEAIEVLGELHEYLPAWKSNSDNEEALAVIRRSFHTLKGSGRLLGAEMIGEFSWKFENMLNCYIENKIVVSDAMLQALDEALAVLPQLIEQLKGNREPVDNIGQLMASADAIADGREFTFESTEEQIDIPIDELTDDPVGEDLIEISVEDDSSSVDTLMFDDVVIGDDSDADITELDAENNFSIEQAQDDSDSHDEVELIIEVEDTVSKDNVSENIVPQEEENAADLIEETFDISEGDEVEVIPTESISELDLVGAGDELDIDPMLLKIYHNESVDHLNAIKKILDEHDVNGLSLQIDKVLLRAFHTLYGSARTAEVEAIADLAGAAEKYIKARQDGGEDVIPDDIVPVIREIEVSVTSMLERVLEGKMPESNKELHDKTNKIVQKEIQSQLQKSWKDNVESDSVEEVMLDDTDESSVFEVDEQDLIEIDVSDDEEIDITAESASVSEESDAGDLISDEPVSEEPVDVSYGDIDDELIDIFLEEAEELLENCEQTLIGIKDQPNSTEHIQQLQRNMHTLKGGARMADLAPVGDLTHSLESLVVMVAENKVKTDKAWFDLLQESLDALTAMLANVKKRLPLSSVTELNERVELLMRGEVHEKRSVERFDIELDELESSDDEEELEDIDISKLLPERRQESDKTEIAETQKNRRKDDKKKAHWGERATDVNFKDSQELVRVRSDLLNNLVDYAGEVNIYHARMGKQVTDFGFNLSELTQTVVRLKEQLRNLEIETEIQIRSGYEKESDNFDDSFDPLEMDQYSTMQQLTRSLGETAGDVESINEILTDITRDSETLLVQESRISSDLQEGLMRTRMVRFGGLSSRLRRIVRQVSRELDKEVEVVIEGESSEVDRTVLDRIIAPLEHMLRNAVAHGIEKPDARRVLGKNESGTISINVSRQGSDVVIKVKDDGAGIDAEKIRHKAIEKELLTSDSKLSDRDVLQFILHSGFSTADVVTQVAGRGVGMDVVDSEIKQLGGVLEIDTIQGKGTEFTVRLPLTLAINQALLVSAADDVFAVPLASIEGVVRITGLELQRFYDSENSHYEFNGVEYELKHLGSLLTGNQSDYSKQLQLFPVLLVNVGDQHFALHVEDLLGRREIVVKPVGLQIGSVHGITGATILADGRVVLILEMSALVMAESLFASTTTVEAVEAPVIDEVKTIMVVDDSITIRKITERMLKRYGIEVVLAKDGVDATNKLQDNIPDLMLLDIEMPRMDGFEVAGYVRNDERLKDIPIIMITSRTGSKHKEKAMEIGVNQYLGKPFQEDDLISNINEILDTSF